ncbi:MAG: Glutamate-tRNA ligase 1 [Candidatus Amesbacteria bacterium GW2011_GWB1_47_26]|uniref:Glutamate--tRNA ligase n=1 Tax=Candidatus Amesbacteria bacterium GW2011_GWC2_45_19 TaxID=1618366 RepID=A0A0G1M533_9BACT|nr:MAG: Glutamate-tRNA ligase 1 [Candidatus Amesbacteria bacterium GW2011_GWC2_45_19]KKU38535.1 MAG: Glutamate-tRNA ligase 1 [Candidatus Amesbacteria bacterium GW2011_GWA1_46_35]KKU69644.1 MAG: Glutamate-tRNA ligase 1 [Microgenomates group bacterium GW2011_GWC1_47_20]KKU73133.1 MAG: Glutamate-tRNA ligase 1 [Candidatus Amesbacteria bacterium GW2011_GWB1_47_26]
MIRTRFAPSPTGFLHIGGLRTAAYAYALAKHSGGKFILRIEDTDQKREIKGAREKLQGVLHKFGLRWDEHYIQSERAQTNVYKQAAQQLVEKGLAYRDLGAIRLKTPKDEKIEYHDFALKKTISWATNDIPEAVLLKSDGFPTYHLAVVVDDHEMNISHVLRAAEWIPSTPIHLLLYKYFGFKTPEIGHLTDILDPEGGKLSKRKGNVSVEQFLELGFLPEAILNFVILLGWAPKDNRELYSLDEFVKAFDPAGFQKSNPVLNQKKLDWFNGHYIRIKSDTELLQLIKPYLSEITLEIIPLIKDRLTTLVQARDLAGFFFTRPQPQRVDANHLRFAIENYDKLIKGELTEDIKNQGWKVGDFFMSLRLAICGSKITPPLTESMLILGKDETLARIKL